MKSLYKTLAKVLWFFVKLVGQVVVLGLKLVAPAVARKLQQRLNDTGRPIGRSSGTS